ncbi:MAG TPA: metal ABC transporter permease [Ignavibacteriaceae bacterium]|nr:metal ABC transporter permease [Ignavibacteriaceae bacterium]
MEIIQQLIEIFPYAILGSILAGIICGFLGVFVVSQRVVFLGASLTQVAIAGVAFSFLHLINIEAMISSLFNIVITEDSFLHHFEPAFFSLLFSLLVVIIFSQTHRQKYLTQDGLLGIIFVAAIAARIMIIQKSPVAELSEIESIMKGDILFIGSREFYSLFAITFFVITFFTLFQKQLKFVVFDAESSSAYGINSKLWLLLFYIVVGTGISLTTRYVGDVFTFAYLIIPSAIGIMIGKSVLKVFLIAVIIGALLPPIALFLAFKYDFSSGPMAVVLAFAVFLIVLIYKKVKEN